MDKKDFKIWELNKVINMQNIILIIIIGMISNLAVIVRNDLEMPVYFHNINNFQNDSGYKVFTDIKEINYWYLSDIININDMVIFSIGDILIYSGLMFVIGHYIMFIIQRTKYKNELKEDAIRRRI